MGQSNGVLLREVVAFQRCILTGDSLYTHTHSTYVCIRMYVHTYVRIRGCTVHMYVCTYIRM